MNVVVRGLGRSYYGRGGSLHGSLVWWRRGRPRLPDGEPTVGRGLGGRCVAAGSALGCGRAGPGPFAAAVSWWISGAVGVSAVVAAGLLVGTIVGASVVPMPTWGNGASGSCLWRWLAGTGEVDSPIRLGMVPWWGPAPDGRGRLSGPGSPLACLNPTLAGFAPGLAQVGLAGWRFVRATLAVYDAGGQATCSLARRG